MNNQTYVNFAIEELGKLWKNNQEVLSFTSVQTISKMVEERFGISQEEANTAAEEAFNYWVAVYVPE